MRKPRRARKRALASALPTTLRAIRTAIVKSQLACDFDAAFDLLLFQFARSVFTSGYHDDALDIRTAETPDRPAMRVNDDAFGTINVGEKHLEIDRAAQKLDWTGLSNDGGLRRTAGASRTGQTDTVRVLCRAHAEGPTGVRTQSPAGGRSDRGPARHRFRRSAVRGNRDQVWTADLLWSRLRKDRILAIARETLGETWAQAEAKQKKADIAKAMQDAFAPGDGVPRRGHGRGPCRGRSPGRHPASAPSIRAPSTTKRLG